VAGVENVTNVVKLHEGREPDDVLEAMKGTLQDVLVLGVGADGTLHALASADMTPPDVVWMMALVQHQLAREAIDA
jgi:hypothetical protein